MVATQINVKVKQHDQHDTTFGNENILVLFNDEYHSCDYVIDCLIEVCKHDSLQAEQCMWTAHYQGRCDIKKGAYSVLKNMHDSLTNRELIVEIQ